MPHDVQGLGLFILGLLLLAGFAAHTLGARVHVPRVTLLLLLGLLIGPAAFDLVPPQVVDWFPVVAHMALGMVGFLLGESLAGKQLKGAGQTVLWVSIGETLLTALLVFLVVLFWEGLVPALLLAGIAPASAPAATLDTVRAGKGRGPLATTVLGVVAIDDAWGVILFGLLLAVAEAVTGQGGTWTQAFMGLREVLGAIAIGAALGIPMAWLTGRLKPGEPGLLEAGGFVFVCAGLSAMANVPYLLACMVLGIVVANRAKHYTRPFHEIEGVTGPFLAVFFILAGVQLELSALPAVGLLGLVYVIARSAGLILGGKIGANIAGAPEVVRKRVGWCLLPQAGVALGLMLLACERLPDARATILPLIIATTVVFEVAGPFFLHWQLRRAGELSN